MILESTRIGHTATPLPSAPTDTMAVKSETLGSPDPTIPRRHSGILGPKAGEEADPYSKPGGGRTCLVNPHSKSPLRRRRGPCVEVTARGPRLQPLPSAPRAPSCSVVCGEENLDTRHVESGHVYHTENHFMRQSISSKAGCLAGEGNGNAYWDILGKKGGGDVHHNGDVKVEVEQSEGAVTSVVLLRWAMECFVGNEDEEIIDGDSNGGHRGAKHIGQAGDDSVGGTSTFQGKAMNVTISGPVHLMHSERKPRDSDLFLFEDPLENDGKRSADGSNSPRKSASTSFAATSPTPLAFSRSRSSERPKEVRQPLPRRELRVSVGDGRERRSPPGDNYQDSFVSDVSDVSAACSSPRQETKHAARGEDGPGRRNSWIAGRTTASRGESAEDVKSTKRCVCGGYHFPFVYSLSSRPPHPWVNSSIHMMDRIEKRCLGVKILKTRVVDVYWLDLMLKKGNMVLQRIYHITFLFRWLAPAAQDTALHALVCLLRAVEVDVCCHREIDSLDTGGRVLDIDTVGGGRAVAMEEGVLLLVLKACAMFQDHEGVVKACCMLMRVGVQCSLNGGGTKVRIGRLSIYSIFRSLQDHSKSGY